MNFTAAIRAVLTQNAAAPRRVRWTRQYIRYAQYAECEHKSIKSALGGKTVISQRAVTESSAYYMNAKPLVYVWLTDAARLSETRLSETRADPVITQTAAKRASVCSEQSAKLCNTLRADDIREDM